MWQESSQDLLENHQAGSTNAARAKPAAAEAQRWDRTEPGHALPLPTDDEGLFGLCPMFVVPRRPASCVDGPLAGPQQGWLGLALASSPLSGWLGGAHCRVQPV